MKKSKIIGVIIVLLAVIGFRNVSAETTGYNYRTCLEELPQQVIRKNINEEYKFLQSGIPSSGVIEFLDNTDTYLLYCSDRTNTFQDAATLTKANTMDYKIAYILRHGYGNTTPEIVDNVTAENPLTHQVELGKKGQSMADIWVTQVALWKIQGSISKNDLDSSNPPLSYQFNDTESFTMYRDGKALNATTLWQYVEKLVAEANNAQNPEEAALKVEGSKEWTKSDNISKSGLITISSTSSLAQVSNYSLSLDNAPEGTKVYKEDGTEITNNATNIPGGTKIYITVDNNKLDKSKEYNFKLNAKANIIYDAAYQYVDNSNQCNGQACQPSVLVGPETKDIQGSLDLKIIPDTASSLSKSIYYIGFIVLLCGVGMIYANVRPKRQEEE